MSKHRTFSAEFKSRVVLEILSGPRPPLRHATNMASVRNWSIIGKPNSFKTRPSSFGLIYGSHPSKSALLNWNG